MFLARMTYCKLVFAQMFLARMTSAYYFLARIKSHQHAFSRAWCQHRTSSREQSHVNKEFLTKNSVMLAWNMPNSGEWCHVSTSWPNKFLSRTLPHHKILTKRSSVKKDATWTHYCEMNSYEKPARSSPSCYRVSPQIKALLSMSYKMILSRRL